MVKVYSSQFNYQYGNQIHFPYSIARLVTYVNTKQNLAENFIFEKTFIFRDKVDEYIEKCKDPEILLCSCYVWNWEITNYLAKKIKEKYPNCLIIFGGPHVPGQSEGFFQIHPYVDIIVHGEGEHVLGNILNAYIKNKNFIEVKGIETKDFRNPPEDRINDLDSLPSPYLTNMIWKLTEKEEGIDFLASWETNRGCPYQCTFCDWGSATFTKLRAWGEDRLFKEIEWFADNKIPYIDCCDANFGIYQEKDMEIAKKLKEQALEKGYPQRFRPAWAKFSSEKIIPIAKELQSAGLLKAVTLSVQSLDEPTLKIIKRANIKFDRFSELTETFRKNEIPTYTELILGLPGETLDSFKNGLETLASDTEVGAIYIYNCGILPNAPMNDVNYREFYKIKSIKTPIFLAHSSIHDRGNMQEYEHIAIETSSYTLDELKKMYLYGWLIQTFHSLGIFEYITKYYKKTYDLPIMKFYDAFIDFCTLKQSIFSDEYNVVIEYIHDGYSGKGWNHHDPNLGDIFWSIEEASWLRLVLNKSKLLETTLQFLTFLEEKYQLKTPDNLLHDLVKFQLFLLTSYDSTEIKHEQFNFNWKDYFSNNSKLNSISQVYYYKNLILENDKILWCYKVVWYGRGPKNYKFHPERLEENIPELSLSKNV
jgi:radical SAM superfamily enzyme YgiQ (UPF0313 family)